MFGLKLIRSRIDALSTDNAKTHAIAVGVCNRLNSVLSRLRENDQVTQSAMLKKLNSAEEDIEGLARRLSGMTATVALLRKENIAMHNRVTELFKREVKTVTCRECGCIVLESVAMGDEEHTYCLRCYRENIVSIGSKPKKARKS